MDVDDPADMLYLAERGSRAISQQTGVWKLRFRLTV
jgi:hypothetical protein